MEGIHYSIVAGYEVGARIGMSVVGCYWQKVFIRLAYRGFRVDSGGLESIELGKGSNHVSDGIAEV